VICTVGDVLLDVIVRLEDAIATDTDAYGRTHVGAGGQAANVAAWAAALGRHARFIGKRGRDAAGRLVTEELHGRGVEVAGPEVVGRTGTVVSIATPDGKRTMLTDRGVAPDFEPAELDGAWLEGCEWLHVPGYSLARSPLAETAEAAARLAPRVSVDLSSTAAIASVGPETFRERVRLLAPAIVFGTEDEAALVGDLEADTVVLKRGALGCRVDGRSYEAPAVEVVDTTGAGDAFAAGFLVGDVVLALEAAARCVGAMGAMPPG
jgi:sugar/nucleoside kinase (ribokinase family)